MDNLLITNANIVNEGRCFYGDVFIKDGRIACVDSDLQHLNTAKIVDAKGKLLIPGMIDDQVHFREPGLTHKGTIETESKAAVAGGITSFLEMPNVSPPTLTRGALRDKLKLAEGRAWANYGFYLGASNDNIQELIHFPFGDACGIKVFMGASTGNMLVDDDEVLERIFKEAPVVIATHCEDTPTIEKNLEHYKKQYGDNIPLELHPQIRNVESCYKSSSKAVGLAKKFGAMLHVLHITTEKELELFELGPISQKSITLEVCVHHLFFNDQDYASKGNLIKCNPSIKTKTDQEALLKALVDDRIDIIATDHAPHTLLEKQSSYLNAPSGLPLVQHGLQVMLDLYHAKKISLEKIVEKTSHNVASRFKIADRGYIREGYWADLVLIDLNREYFVKNEDLFYKCGWSPFEGHSFCSVIDATIINGKVVYKDGKFIENSPGGQKLTYSYG